MKTSPETVKLQFELHGLSIREWAQAQGFSERLVYAVLSGKSKGMRGESFRIAVALGLRHEPRIEDAPTFVKDALLQRAELTQHNHREVPMT
ncbi:MULTISPECIES: DNA-binding protein [Hydrogenophaga]|uniref:DNA-binding protein n=1 Tax=Hydrogenophaga TaxID=47420 RepID=UPI001CF99019|nr:DNA-binding protein [Hydrogenophaga taeniospiralis]